MERHGDQRHYHITEHLWLVEIPQVGAAFEVRDDAGWPISHDNRLFPSRAEACRAYREGYAPNVVYPRGGS